MPTGSWRSCGRTRSAETPPSSVMWWASTPAWSPCGRSSAAGGSSRSSRESNCRASVDARIRKLKVDAHVKTNEELGGQIRRIDTLIEDLENCEDPAARDQARGLVAALLEFHGAALTRLFDHVRAA